MKAHIIDLLGIIDSAKSLHWQTTSYSVHKASESLYSGLNELVDSFVETYQGKYDRLNISGLTKIEPLDGLSLCNMLSLIAANMELEIRKEDTDLLNIIADIKSLSNHTKYLLTLS